MTPATTWADAFIRATERAQRETIVEVLEAAIADARRRGAEEMRERAAKLCDEEGVHARLTRERDALTREWDQLPADRDAALKAYNEEGETVEVEANAWCPECGPIAYVDEDGCCRTCGNGAMGPGADEALRLRAERDQAETNVLRAAKSFARVTDERDALAADVDRLRAERDATRDDFFAYERDAERVHARLTRERDALAAVVEEVWALADDVGGEHGQDILEILGPLPADVLRKRDERTVRRAIRACRTEAELADIEEDIVRTVLGRDEP